MAFFRGCLYVGTTCAAIRGPQDTPRILRFHPQAAEWQVVYTPPLVATDRRAYARDIQLSAHMAGSPLGGRKRQIADRLPRDFGYRSMTVFQGASDPEPTLYVASLSLWGSVILRSLDGERFDVVCDPGFGNSSILSFRGLVGHAGRLFVSPAGTITDDTIDRNFPPQPSIYCCEDPLSGNWQEACNPGFGDENNLAIYSLARAHGRLYAGTGNPRRGFQVWCTDGLGEPPFAWTRVLTDGAYRYNFNMATAAMAEFDGALYVGGGIPGFGYDKANDVGPAAAELVRVFPDATWDLIFGEPRFTPDGLKIPISGKGPGLDDFYNSVVWTMATHEGALFVGTHQWEPYEEIKTGRQCDLRGGAQLWMTRDGESWSRVIDRGFGNVGVLGFRTLASTPFGLFVGTMNHTELLRMLTRLSGRTLPTTARSGFEVLLV